MKHFPVPVVAAAVMALFPSCGKKETGAVTINGKGSDTMIQLATAWAEAYRREAPHIQVNASGGGSGTGVAALQNGTADIAFSSREMKPEEIAKVKETTGKAAVEHAVAYDALAVYVHKNNPLEVISIEELTQVWAEGGEITQWEQLTPNLNGNIILIGRQNNSGTYDYFREHVLGQGSDGKQREFRKGISELNGSAEVVENVAKTPTAIGYSGMGYKTDAVNWLPISKVKGGDAVEPGVDAARQGTYPIARKLYIYTAGEPTGAVKEFLDWVVSPGGQAVVKAEGFVPLN